MRLHPLKQIRAFLRAMDEGWRGARLSKVALGKYIILFASILHVAWAVLLLIDPAAGSSTPLRVIVVVCGGAIRTAFVLTITAGAAAAFPFLRRRVSNAGLALMLIPQQALLLMSAGAGIYAACVSHYADGVTRSWAFILADQLPVILGAMLYTAAVIEAAFEPPERFTPVLPDEDA